MAVIKALEKLRKSLKACTNKAGVEPNQFDTYWITANACDMLIDEVEAEIADNYMRLPCDADGVPLHVGDEIVCSYGVDKVEGVHPERIFLLHENKWLCVQAQYKKHYKPRTLEDVLEEYYDKRGWDECDNCALEADSLTNMYADEIRELMKEGGDD